MSWSRTCANVSFLQFKERESKEDDIVVEARSILKSAVRAVQGCSAGYSAETLTLFRNDVGEQVM